MRSLLFGLMAAFAISLSATSATQALAGATPEQKCQAATNTAAGKYAACRQSAEKNLVSTGDAGKYAAAIGKCETKFGEAWQKAIDGAEAAGAACPDAPLGADDYKSVIDFQSENIATALGGGDLVMPSTCGNGTLEAGEACDFTTPLPTCSDATGGTQTFGHVMCGAGCTANTSACHGCTGVTVFGACWYVGSLGQSCAGACSARGLAYDPATALGAGYDGCLALLLAFWGPHPFNQIQGGGNEGTACNFFNASNYAVYSDANQFTADATTSNLHRVCACRQP
jgi:hypothetical protein